jgi:hypothetical protein
LTLRKHKNLSDWAKLSKKDIAKLSEPLEVEGRKYTRKLQLYLRPSVFGECQAQNLGTEKNPCPFVSCKWNLTLDVNEKGNVLDNQIDNMTNEQTANCQYTCVLQAIANYSTPSDILSVSRQRVSQIVQQSIEKIKNAIRETHENTSKFEDFSH